MKNIMIATAMLGLLATNAMAEDAKPVLAPENTKIIPMPLTVEQQLDTVQSKISGFVYDMRNAILGLAKERDELQAKVKTLEDAVKDKDKTITNLQLDVRVLQDSSRKK